MHIIFRPASSSHGHHLNVIMSKHLVAKLIYEKIMLLHLRLEIFWQKYNQLQSQKLAASCKNLDKYSSQS